MAREGRGLTIRDGIVTTDRIALGVCWTCNKKPVHLLHIKEITLPEGIKPSSRLIAFQDEKRHIEWIGLSCGCYARFHRQIAHILNRRVNPTGKRS